MLHQSLEAMTSTYNSSTCLPGWRTEFDRLLETMHGLGIHGQLVDIRESLRYVLGPNRPLVMLCPHADDGAITAACLLHEYAVRRGLAGDRGPGLRRRAERGRTLAQRPEEDLGPRGRVPSRVQRARGRGGLLGPRRATARRATSPRRADIDKIVDWFSQRRPGAVIVPAGQRRPRRPPGDPAAGGHRPWSAPA